jgi:alanine racemase
MDFSFGLKRKYISLNTVEINRKNLLFNFDFFNKETGLEIWPVLKSNAYGHGIKQVVRILEERDFEYLVIDGYHEVLEIRKITKRPVLMIGEIRPENFPKINWKNVTMMVGDKETIKTLGEYGKKVTVHLKVNTGMNRQGVDVDEIEKMVRLIKKYPKLELEGVFSHLAEADEVGSQKTDYQLKQFEKAIEIVRKNGIELKFCHLAATAGALKIKSDKVNAIRLGIGLYGINVLEKGDKYFKKMEKLRPVLSFKSVFTTLRRIKQGEKVSYSGTWQANKDTNIGVIPVGYNEGLDRRLSNKGWVKYKNKFYPVVGRVCMNLAMVNLGNTKAKLFNEVEIISNNRKDKNSIENMASVCKTIPYDLLVKINSSIRRIIV